MKPNRAFVFRRLLLLTLLMLGGVWSVSAQDTINSVLKIGTKRPGSA